MLLARYRVRDAPSSKLPWTVNVLSARLIAVPVETRMKRPAAESANLVLGRLATNVIAIALGIGDQGLI